MALNNFVLFTDAPSPYRKKKKVKNMEDVLLQVNKKHVRIQKEDRKKNNTILFTVLDKILKRMRSCDKLFSSLKPRLEYLGSYFDGLRVGRPTEYDINIVLTFYINYDKITLVSSKTEGAYASVVMPSEFRRLSKIPATASKGFKETELWCDASHRLSMQRFRSWMQKVVDSALNTLPVENGMKILEVNNKLFQIASKTSGPAFTLTIIENSDNIIDIDLVPTLAFDLPKTPKYTNIHFERVRATNIKQYFAVPKPTNDDFSWRLAFPYQEKYYLYNKNNMKSVIKILKLLRDTQGFHKLASYYIKTLFLWEAVENTDRFWKTKSLSFLVIYMMRKLKECLSNQNIRNFWCPDHNLLETIQAETCQNWSNRLSHIINDIESNKKNDPFVIRKYLTDRRSGCDLA